MSDEVQRKKAEKITNDSEKHNREPNPAAGVSGKRDASIFSFFSPLHLSFFFLLSIPHPRDVFLTASSEDFIILLPEGLIPV